MRGLHVAGGPRPLGEAGWDAAAANEAEGFLDLLVSERVYDRVDDGVVGGGQEGGVGVDGGIGGIGDQGIERERHPAGGERPQDDGQGGDPLAGGHVVRGGQEVALQGDLVGVPHHDLADLDVELQHEREREEEGDGQDGRVVLGEGSDHAAGGLVTQAVPAQHGQQPQADAGPPEQDQHDIGQRDRPLRMVRQSVIQGEVAVNGDGQQAADGGGERGDDESDADQLGGFRLEQVGKDEVDDEPNAGQQVRESQAPYEQEHRGPQAGAVEDDEDHDGVFAGDEGSRGAQDDVPGVDDKLWVWLRDRNLGGDGARDVLHGGSGVQIIPRRAA